MIGECNKILEACCICVGQNLSSICVPYKDDKETWITKLRFCVDKIIWSSDNVICEVCAEQLDLVYKFHQLCHSSNEKRQNVLKTGLTNKDCKDAADKKKEYTKSSFDESSVCDDLTTHLLCEHCDTLGFQDELELKEHYTIEHLNLDTVKKKSDLTNASTTKIKLRYKRRLHTRCVTKKNEKSTDRKCDTASTNLCHNVLVNNRSNLCDSGSNRFVEPTIPAGHISPKAQSNDTEASANLVGEKWRLHDDICKITDSYAELEGNCSVAIQENYVSSKYKRRSARIKNTSKSTSSVADVANNYIKEVSKKEMKSLKLGESSNSENSENVNATQIIGSLDYNSDDSSTDNNCERELEHLDNSNDEPSVKSTEKNSMNFKCDLCESTFTYCIKFMEHSVSVHHLNEKDVRPYACSHCPKKFNKHSTLKDHAKSHDPVRNEMCSYCGKAFKTKRALTIHEKQHLNLREYQCPHCPKRFNTHKNRNTHIYILHSDPNTWKHVCHICQKKFALKTTYIAHMRIHSTFKQFACHLCDKRFTDRTTLRNHLTSHSNVREHKCSECGNEYKNIKYLKVHMAKAHSIGNIKLPVRVKKHICHMCPKAFCYKNKLLRHIYTHTGERPFPCSVCDKRFTDKSYAVQHMKSIHNILPDTTEVNL